MSQPYPWAHKQFNSKTCKNAKRKHEIEQKQMIIETKKKSEKSKGSILGESILGWYH